MNSHYAILGLSPNASEEDIRKAYRNKVKLYHPDVNKSPDANAKFLMIQMAYETLTDKNRRFFYDQKVKTAQDHFYTYQEWANQQRVRKEQEAKMRYQAYMKRKKKIQSSKFYYTYMMSFYLSTLFFISMSLFVLTFCAFLIFKHNIFWFFFLLPFICVAAYVFKYTLDKFKSDRDYYHKA